VTGPAESRERETAPNEVRPSLFSWVQVVAGWVLVGVPLLWGIWMTFRKAIPLFQ
jgi:hypothetical protein